MISSKEALRALAQEAALMPQEKMAPIGSREKQLYIGLPRETTFQENRVALVPEAVALLVSNGHEVVVESKAGKAANFSDHEYSEAGAKVTSDIKEIYKADIVIKVAPPTDDEVKLMNPKQTVLSALQLPVQPKDFLKKLMDKKVTALAWDYFQDDDGTLSVIRSMGEIAGNTSILIAAELLSSSNNGKGMMFGGITGVKPSNVVIIGAGTVGEFATRAALGLGADVKVFDNNIYKLRRLQNAVGQPIWTSIIQPDILEQELASADVLIGSLRAKRGRTPIVVTEHMVQQMAEGSVIVDVSIDQGGCVETSKVTNHTKPVYTEHGVVHYCVPNIASRVPRTASRALSNIFAPLLISIGDEGGVEGLIKTHPGARNGVYVYNGKLTSPILGEAFKLPYKDIELLLAAM